MFKIKNLFLLTTLTIVVGHVAPLLAQNTSSSQQEFQEGLKAYATSQYQEARNHFQNALIQDPTSDTLLYNLALTEYRLGQFGWALAHLRKALFLNPWSIQSKNLINEVAAKVHSPNTSDWSLIAQLMFWSEKIPFGVTQILTLFILLLVIYFGFKSRRRGGAPNGPAKIIVLCILFLVFGAAATFQIVSGLQPKASVGKDTQVRTGPSEDQPEIYLISEGELVRVKEQQGDWLRIENQNSHQGWIKAENVFVINQGELTW